VRRPVGSPGREVRREGSPVPGRDGRGNARRLSDPVPVRSGVGGTPGS
jgi:hypothetical protein